MEEPTASVKFFLRLFQIVGYIQVISEVNGRVIDVISIEIHDAMAKLCETVNQVDPDLQEFLSDPVAVSSDGSQVHWNYDRCSIHGPLYWSKYFKECNGFKQSPIDIDTNYVMFSQPHRIRYVQPHAVPVSGRMVNNGHAPTYQLDPPSAGRYHLIGVPGHENDIYVLHQFHVHFSHRSDKGSEHQVNGKRFDGELHFVHYNRKYGSFEEAMKHPDGLTVIGIFLEVGLHSSQELAHIIDTFTRIANVESERNITYYSMDFLRRLDNFYTYEGSLTTPTCLESVSWIVLRDPLHIPERTLKVLRMMEGEGGHRIARDGNTRPIQSRNGRKIEANFHPPTFNTGSSGSQD